MGVISLRNIRKIYPGRIVAVQDFSLEIEDGEFLVLVGPSGCGKTTLLRMIAGLEEISSGELWIDGLLVNGVPPAERNIAMVFQNYALYPHMTVYQNMELALKLRGMDRHTIRRRIEEAAAVLDITHLLGRRPRVLSGGERQRAALGRAMVRDPAVFLLDEPLSNLDAKLRTQMRTELIRLHRRLGTTFIYVTHDQTEAMTMGDRIVVMEDGFIQQVDRPQRLYSEPANQFVADFIGSPPMNFFTSALTLHNGEICVFLNGTALPVAQKDAAQQRLEPFLNQPVLVGFRPEAVRPVQRDAAQAVNGTIVLTERLGAEILLRVNCGEQELCLKQADWPDGAAGEAIHFTPEPDSLHLFFADGQVALYP